MSSSSSVWTAVLAAETSAAAAAWISGAPGAEPAPFCAIAEPVAGVPEAAIIAAATKAKYRALLVSLTFLSGMSGLFMFIVYRGNVNFL